MSKTNLISTMRFLSLATAALVTGPTATYAATNSPSPKLDRSAAANAGKEPCPQNEVSGAGKAYRPT